MHTALTGGGGGDGDGGAGGGAGCGKGDCGGGGNRILGGGLGGALRITGRYGGARLLSAAPRASLGDGSWCRRSTMYPMPEAASNATTIAKQHHPKMGTRSVVGCRRPVGTGW